MLQPALRIVSIFALSASLAAAQQSPPANSAPLTNEAIIRMVLSGTPSDAIVRTIAAADKVAFTFLPGDLELITRYKVSDEVFKAMAAKSNGRPIPGLSPTSQSSAVAQRPPENAISAQSKRQQDAEAMSASGPKRHWWRSLGQGFGEGLAAMAAAQQATAGSSTGLGTISAKLMIFGGTNHAVYLGCLNCSEYATDSVKNEFGMHGSTFSQESIFNEFGPYGSPYSSTSACNPYASDPPVIVDQAGRYYGRLTLNAYNPQIGIGSGMMGWLAAACKS